MQSREGIVHRRPLFAEGFSACATMALPLPQRVWWPSWHEEAAHCLGGSFRLCSCPTPFRATVYSGDSALIDTCLRMASKIYERRSGISMMKFSDLKEMLLTPLPEQCKRRHCRNDRNPNSKGYCDRCLNYFRDYKRKRSHTTEFHRLRTERVTPEKTYAVNNPVWSDPQKEEP